MNIIITEMGFQKQFWDNENSNRTPEEWVSILSVYLGKLASETKIYKRGTFSDAGYRKRLVQLAALTNTALEKILEKDKDIEI